MLASSTTFAITIVCLNVHGLGATTLDELASNGSHASVSERTSPSWNTQNDGGTGTVVITALTPSHVVGTFSFDAPSSAGSAGGTLHVTNGSFDIVY